MIIAIGGSHGSGKTTYAKILARRLKLRHLSAGDLFREIARKKKISLEELGQLALKDPSIDRQIDNRTKRLAKIGNVVVDGQLAAWMLRDSANLKVYLTAPDDTRLRRVADRDGTDFKAAKKETIAREAAQYKRYLKLYDIDLLDLSPYDMILDTSMATIPQIASMLVEAARSRHEHIVRAKKRINDRSRSLTESSGGY